MAERLPQGHKALRLRVVARRGHRTDKVAWFATNAEQDEFGASDVMRLYFDRWPLQEHVFRDGNGRVGLDVHHGYGKKKITDVAVVDRKEQLQGRSRKVASERRQLDRTRTELARKIEAQRQAVARVEEQVGERAAALDARVASGDVQTADFQAEYQVVRSFQAWLPSARQVLADLAQADTTAKQQAVEADATLQRLATECERLERRTRIFTVDTELDQIMTAYKLTFMNVASYLMREILGVNMQMDTLIRSILSLPGERIRNKTTEVIRIYRQPRDERAMAAVQTAVDRLNAMSLCRDKRRLSFELVDAPR